MLRSVGVALGLLAHAPGCAGGAAAPPTPTSLPDVCRTPSGARAEASLEAGERDLHGYTLHVRELPAAEPQVVTFELRVSGARSRRRLRVGGTPQRPCGPYAAPDDPCAEVGIGLFATDLQARLAAMDNAASVTLHHVEVHDWGDLDEAVVALGDALRAWRMADPFRVAVRPMSCGVLLKGKR